MPFVKTTFSLVSNDASLADSDVYSAVLVTLCRQIGQLAQCCEMLVGELVAEVDKVAARTHNLVEKTSKLAAKIEQLDDEAASARKCKFECHCCCEARVQCVTYFSLNWFNAIKQLSYSEYFARV